MLYFDRIDVSDEIDVKKTSEAMSLMKNIDSTIKIGTL